MSRSLISFLILVFSTVTAFAEMGVPIQLKLKSPSGTYPTEAGLSFKLLILSPGSNCILREENFSSQSINNGSVSLVLGNGARGVNDPALSLNQVYDNSKSKTGLSCVDGNNNVVSVAQVYNPVAGDQRTIRVTSTISGDPILVNFTMRSTPFAIQAESVGGKPAADIIVNDAASQMNQTNLNDLLLDVGRFNNLKNLAVSGQAITANSAVNFTGSLVGDVGGTQGATSVDRIKGVPVSATAPSNNQILQFNGAQYVPVNLPPAPVTSVAGRTGAIVLSSSDISGLTFGTAANTFAQGNDSRITGALQSSSVFSGDVSGTISSITVNRVGGKTSTEIANSVNDTQAATATNTASTIVKRDGSGNISASSVSATNNSTQNVYVYEATNTNSVRIKAPGSFSNYTLTLPVDAGTSGQVLQTDGSGNLSWLNPSTGSVTAVSASAPLASSGGTTPNISIAQASSSVSGYLSSGDWSVFNNKQAALGFVPLNPSNNLSDVASTATARTNLGLGGAAVLNVGTVAGTVAAGDDARINGALQNSAFNAYVASASCTSTQSMYWNSVSGQFECQAINFPADAVTSVAGRTGAVVLSSSDISGLGNSASRNVGTSAGTVAAGDDSRITGALQSSSVFSGDVSGTVSSINVNRIRGVTVSATAPTSNQVLQYNGSQYVPATLPSAPVTTVAGRTGAVVLSSSDISGLGAAAALNVGTSAGTVAAGNDSRIVNALQPSSVHSGDVSGTLTALSVDRIKGVAVSATAPTTNQVLQYNGTQYVPATLPSAPVTTVAGRTGAVVLSSSDISGLTFGTSANTFAQGNDSRITGALQSSSVFSGDVSGTISAINVNKIRGVAVSATAPALNQVLQYDGSQYVPVAIPSAPVSSVAGRTGAIILSSSDISGLGAAAALNVGTSAGTVAAGDDSRITGALQSSAFNGYVASASCTSGQSMYWNSVSSQFDCQSISFPADAVTSVAGRTGAVVLTSSDISGLGNSASRNVGTTAGTVAAGDDSRITGALQSSSAFSGDVSGTSTTVAVNRIRGVTVSATAPTTNQVLQYNGTQYVPATLPSAPVTTVAGRTGAIVLSSSDISGLGDAAELNVGTSAGTVAAGNDSRIVNAVQTSSVHSGDVSGTVTTLSVNRIRGVTVSATAPTLNQVLQFDGSQYVPVAIPSAPVSSVAGRTGAVVLSSSDISGLGGAAVLNVGTSAGTVAAGNDSRIVNALQNTTVASAACTSSQSMYWSSVTSEFLCQSISFPADAVTSVAGRTGAVVLSSSDISGLGAAAALNVGTTAGTVAAGNDSRIVNALQPSSAHSGDVSGTLTALSVDRIKGVAVSATAPTTNQVLQYNGSQYVPATLPSAPVTTVAGRTGAVVLSSSDISGLTFGTAANTFAQGNDSRIVNAVQTSSVHSGDVSGTLTTLSVDRIKGIPISATAPTLNQVLQYDGSQYVPVAIPSAPVSSVAGRTGAVVLSSSDISGLGGAAVLNVGTSAGTVAAGNDSRIVNALQNTTIASAACTSSQSMYWSSVTSEFLCQSISFPADAVTSVAGRTGAVVLTSSDISGLGNSASRNVGTAAGTVAAGDDSRITGALQSSSVFSGDVSGTSTTVAVNRIRGVTVSATAPTTNQVLQYNGTQYVPATLPSAPVTTVAGRTGAVVLSSSDISGLSFGTAANTFAQGNDSRIVNAVQTSSVHSGDVSGTLTTLSVDRIKGVAVSATAPTTNQVLQYDGTQYVPTTLPSAPVTTVAGRTGAVVLSSSDISGLGNSASRNVGAAAGTVAAGDDSRITGALQLTAFNGYVASANCTTSQSMYWNSVSSQFLCQAIAFPADAVTSVAGRTGAVVLSSADVSGLGNVVSRNIGTTAGTAAAGDDSRIVNAFQISSTALSGDISGTSTTVSVDKIKGRNISSTAPTTGQALVWDGTQWVPTTGFPKFIKKTADQTFTATAVANVTLLAIPVVAGVSYKYKFNVLYTAATTGTGLRIGITYPAATISSALANIPGSTTDGTGFLFSGFINNSGDSVMAANTPAATPTVIMANIEGVFVASASGNIQLQAATETAGNAIVIKAGSFVEVVEMP